jgi:hypothetical protein
VAVEWRVPWYGRAALWAAEGLPFVRGHALSRKAMHGGQATHDTSESPTIAALRRGGRRPQAAGYPAAMRATRALLRRRTPLMRHRAALVAPVHKTQSPDTLPASGKQMASKAQRDGGAARCAEAAGPKTIAVDRALRTPDEARLQDLERSLLKAAKPHEATTLSRLPTVPGLGQRLRRVRRDAIHRSDRLPGVHAVASSARLVTCRPESGGNRVGTSGTTLGTAPLKGAFAEAATWCLRNTPQAQTRLARLEPKQDTGTALSSLAHQRGRAGYWMRTRQGACAREMCLQPSGSRAAEPGASRDASGMRRERACATPSPAASLHAKARLGR